MKTEDRALTKHTASGFMEIRLERRSRLGIIIRMPRLFLSHYRILRGKCGLWESLWCSYLLCKSLARSR